MAITFGVQTSFDDDRTSAHVLQLRRLLDRHCVRKYCDEIAEFAPVLRVGGKMQAFDFEGCEKVRRNRLKRYITVDVALPAREWRGRDDRHIRQFLFAQLELGLACCVSRLQRDKVVIDAVALASDLALVRAGFLSTPETGTSLLSSTTEWQ